MTHIPNPTGKGGFGDNPQNKANGRWKKENSQNYCLNYFLQLTVAELKVWEEENPEDKRTVAQSLAWARVVEARKELADYREVVDRTEGKPMQHSDITTGGQTFGGLSIETLQALEKAYETEDQETPSDTG